MTKTVLPDEYLKKMASMKTCKAGDFDVFAAEAAKRKIDRNEASKLFSHWRSKRVLREHMLDSRKWLITEDQIWFSKNHLGRAMTAYYRYL